ncbi:hypothetical protein [Bacillus sp. AFS041924]|uniref:hypothetical protein n=1 Tax=Bacillus sp. AFS041924 TaxID=2033503 RepID=UPI00350E388E
MRSLIYSFGGIYPDATIIQEEKMTMNELAFIKHQNAVSDILGQFYDRNVKLLICQTIKG